MGLSMNTKREDRMKTKFRRDAVDILLIVLIVISSLLVGSTYKEIRMESIEQKPAIIKLHENIFIEMHPNKQVRSYHLKHRNLPRRDLGAIESIPGVITKSGYPTGTYFQKDEYELVVRKGKAFDWANIEPQVLDILSRLNTKSAAEISIQSTIEYNNKTIKRSTGEVSLNDCNNKKIEITEITIEEMP